jgi:geranylgeranyl diphosphate synthase type I
VMDQARVRRGRPSLHVRFAESWTGPAAEAERFGASSALLVADLALVTADRLLATAGFDPGRIVSAHEAYDRMRVDAIAGQYLDLLGVRRDPTDEEDALRVGALKSGRYSVEGPLLVGASLAGADPTVRRALGMYGRALGRAFQVRDDLLGVFGDPEVTGKDSGSDLRHGKRTVVLAKTLRMASEAERRFLEARLGRHDLTDGEVEQVREVVKECGALAETIDLVTSLVERAVAGLDATPIPDEPREFLRFVADLVTVRPL